MDKPMQCQAALRCVLITCSLVLNSCVMDPPMISAHAALASQSTTPVQTTERDKVLWNKATRHCALESTQILSSAEVYAVAAKWVSPSVNIASTTPRLITSPLVVGYPRDLLAAGIPGAVLVMLDIDKDGHVAAARAVCTTRAEFIKPVIDAAKGWLFEPARLDGNAVNSVGFQPVVFQLP
jgi:outer membrane biosynthesis protein TonB